MTYDEFYELAKRMTRTDSGVQYQGAIVNISHMLLFNQLSAPFINPKTNKSLYTTESKWRDFSENFSRFMQIPGLEKPTDTSLFLTQGTAAMMLAAAEETDKAIAAQIAAKK